MQLTLVLAVLAALVVSENSPSRPVSNVGARLAIAGAGMLLVAAFAAISSSVIARRVRDNFHRRYVLLRQFKRLRRAHAVLWLAVAGGILWWLDWARLVRFNWHADRLFLVDELLVLVPVVLPMVLSWAAFYEVDRAVRAGPAGDTLPGAPFATRRQYLALHVRHGLGVLLLPLLVLFAVHDAAELLIPGILESDYSAMVYLPPLVLLFAFFPSVLRYVWNTSPLPPGPLRDRLEAAARRCGCRARDILVWHSGGMLVNAAVAGLLPPLRYVFLSDGLLSELPDEEIEAVFGHEVGHVRHRHLLLRLLAMIAPASLWVLLGQAAPRATGQLEHWLIDGGLGLQLPTGLLMLAAMGCYVLLVFGRYSRLLEGQADLFGCQALASHPNARPVETFVSALERLAAGSGIDRNLATWQHASIARRVDFLNRVAADPEIRRRFDRRVRLLSTLLIGVVVSPVVYQVLFG